MKKFFINWKLFNKSQTINSFKTILINCIQLKTILNSNKYFIWFRNHSQNIIHLNNNIIKGLIQ